MQSRSSFGNSLKDEGDRTPEMWIDLACSKRCSSGYVYALALAKVGDRKGKGRDLIASASGDGDVKVGVALNSSSAGLAILTLFPGPTDLGPQCWTLTRTRRLLPVSRLSFSTEMLQG